MNTVGKVISSGNGDFSTEGFCFLEEIWKHEDSFACYNMENAMGIQGIKSRDAAK